MKTIMMALLVLGVVLGVLMSGCASNQERQCYAQRLPVCNDAPEAQRNQCYEDTLDQCTNVISIILG